MNTVFVSIPLWFSRNEEQRRTAEQQHWVSIPLWFSRNKRSALWIIPHLVVSIPLWFLRNNPQSKLHLKPPFTFPYHYGSYATKKTIKDQDAVLVTFPYHYGSYATRFNGLPLEKRSGVSIPLWFLRNGPRRMLTNCILLWFSRNVLVWEPAGFACTVSIPLWFIQEPSSVDRPRAWTRPSLRSKTRS